MRTRRLRVAAPVSVMSVLERAACSSPPWNLVARRIVLPWALQGARLEGRVLEVGAGSGAMAAQLLASHPIAAMTVTDVDPRMVRRATGTLRRFGGRAQVRVADAARLPFDDDAFDAAVSFLMLHHVGRWEDALRELVRVLRPDGRLLAYDLVDGGLSRLAHGGRRDEVRPVTVPELERLLETLPLARVALRGRRHWFRLSAGVAPA